MRKIIVYEFMSLDGVIQGPGGPDEDTSGDFKLGGWSVTQWDDLMEQAMASRMQQPFDLLLGRFTYDLWAAYWPFVKDGKISSPFNRATKYVGTQTLKEGSWEKTVLLNNNTIEQLTALKAEDGKDLHMYGSADFIQSLLKYGLIDELNLWIFPVVLGSGKKMFSDKTFSRNFKVTKYALSTTGVVLATYQPGGDVPVGRAGQGD
jgi:dihydrofolate reductase